MRILLFFSVLSMLCCTFSVQAQNLPVTIVFSQNKCHFNNIDDLNKMTEEKIGPVLNELVKEGQLLNWGVLTHSWGDEWNWNMFYVAENQSKFQEAWGAMVERVMEKEPNLFEQFGEWCFEHKDSIYSQIAGYTPEEEEAKN
jgi:hypothetical protein